MGKEGLHFATYFSAKQTTKNGKEVLRLAFCGVLRRNKHALLSPLLPSQKMNQMMGTRGFFLPSLLPSPALGSYW